MSKVIKTTLKIISHILIVLSILLAVLLVGMKLVGFDIYTVLSGSMEPAIKTGSVLYVRNANPSKLNTGDIITFRIGEDTTATHRIVEVIDADGTLQFRTKGDANEEDDASLVSENDVIGKYAFSLPYLGYAAAFIQSPSGSKLAIVYGVAVILFVIWVDMITSSKKEKK